MYRGCGGYRHMMGQGPGQLQHYESNINTNIYSNNIQLHNTYQNCIGTKGQALTTAQLSSALNSHTYAVIVFLTH